MECKLRTVADMLSKVEPYVSFIFSRALTLIGHSGKRDTGNTNETKIIALVPTSPPISFAFSPQFSAPLG